MARKKGGWYQDRARHSLAARGVKTTRDDPGYEHEVVRVYGESVRQNSFQRGFYTICILSDVQEVLYHNDLATAEKFIDQAIINAEKAYDNAKLASKEDFGKALIILKQQKDSLETNSYDMGFFVSPRQEWREQRDNAYGSPNRVAVQEEECRKISPLYANERAHMIENVNVAKVYLNEGMDKERR